MTPSNRLNNLRQELENKQLDACLITSVPNITYLTEYSNFSTEDHEAFLFITENTQYILTDGRYSTEIKNRVTDFQLFEISSAYPLKMALKELLIKHHPQTLGIEENDLTVSEYNTVKKASERIINDFKNFNCDSLRMVKESDEIQAIENACKLGDEAFTYILGQIKSSLTEKQLSSKLEYYIKENGAGLSFPPIIAYGANSAVPHHQTGDQRLTANDFLLLDFGVKIDNYCSDMTRTVFLGKATQKQQRIYHAVLEAQQKAMKFLDHKLVNDPQKVSALRVDKVARQYIISQGFPSIPHSLGHGIGLQVQEPPSLSPISKQILKEGMVFSIEPGIYLPDFGGVRIEDLFVIEKGRLRQLTQSPKNLIELRS